MFPSGKLDPRHELRDELEDAIVEAVEAASAPPCPPRLAEAIRYAVLPGGARVRPRLTLAVARAAGGLHLGLANAAAVALELLHCASLVHDDLPMFDDADERRGKPSVHKAFGEPLALLVGDALIVAAFEVLAMAPGPADKRQAITRAVARAAGAPRGIVAGQAWESEPVVDREAYHRAKTGALFVAATTAGAIAGGGPAEAWSLVGERLGEAYQVADDLGDAGAGVVPLGKPLGRDEVLGRPSAVRDLGAAGAQTRLAALVAEAEAAIPLGPAREPLLRELWSLFRARR